MGDSADTWNRNERERLADNVEKLQMIIVIEFIVIVFLVILEIVRGVGNKS